MVFLRLKVLSETYSPSPNSSFPPPLEPPSRVPSSTIWILHEDIILFPNYLFMLPWWEFNLKSTSKIWKTCLFHNSFKSLNLGYYHTHTFTKIYFSIQMQYLINWIRVLSHAYTLNSTCKLIDILNDMIWMLATIV